MEKTIEILMYICVFAFWVGLIKPSLVKMKSRKSSSATFFIILIILVGVKDHFYPKQKSAEEIEADRLIATQKAAEEKRFKHGDMTLDKYRSETVAKRQEIINSYLTSVDIPDSAAGDFYNCLSEYSATKNSELAIGETLGWCANDYKNNPKSLSSRTNFDNFFSNFSGWNGSYRPLEKIIKNSMNDEDSYKHVRTTYRVLLKGKPHAIVSTTFSGTNAYSARVKQTVSADVDVETGQIISVLNAE